MNLASSVLGHFEKSKGKDTTVCLMAADADNLGASICAMYLIKYGHMTVATADETLKDRRISTRIIRMLLDFLEAYRHKSGIEKQEMKKIKALP
jgi:hypothetical protein